MAEDCEEKNAALEDFVLPLLEVLSVMADILIEQLVKPFLVFLPDLRSGREKTRPAVVHRFHGWSRFFLA